MGYYYTFLLTVFKKFYDLINKVIYRLRGTIPQEGNDIKPKHDIIDKTVQQ